MKKIGLFGGTFDPIHLGHLNLALELLEKAFLDEVIFCPSFCSPFKESAQPIASPKARLEMVKLAIEGFEQFSVTDIEIQREGVSYTIDTIKALHKKDVELRLLLGSETALSFEKWRSANEIISLAPPLVGYRGGSKGSLFETVSTRIMEISSTEVRNRLKKGLICKHLIPNKVVDYIYLNKLYL